MANLITRVPETVRKHVETASEVQGVTLSAWLRRAVVDALMRAIADEEES